MHAWGACSNYDLIEIKLLYLVSDELLTWVRAHIAVVCGIDHVWQCLRIFSDCFDIDRASDIQTTMAYENAYARLLGILFPQSIYLLQQFQGILF